MAAKAESTNVDNMNELVTITLPLTREKQDDVFVSLNGQNLLIKRGEEVQIPRWAKEILDNKEAMTSEALRRSMAMPNR